MNLINRYIVMEFTKCFCLVLLSVLGIFIAIDYLGTMDEFIEADISLWRAFQYVLYKIPFICNQAMPVVLLLAILIVFGLMSKNNELIIINSSGISIYALVKPVIAVCATMAVAQFILSEMIVPATMRTANVIKYQEIRKTANVTRHEKNIWIKGRYYSPTRSLEIDGKKPDDKLILLDQGPHIFRNTTDRHVSLVYIFDPVSLKRHLESF